MNKKSGDLLQLYKNYPDPENDPTGLGPASSNAHMDGTESNGVPNTSVARLSTSPNRQKIIEDADVPGAPPALPRAMTEHWFDSDEPRGRGK